MQALTREIIISVLSSLILIGFGWLFKKQIFSSIRKIFFKFFGNGLIDIINNRASAQKIILTSIKQSTQIKYMGVQGNILFSERMAEFSPIGEAIKNHKSSEMKIKILLLDPSSDHVATRADELGADHNTKSINLGISHTIQDVKLLKEVFIREEVSIELRTYNFQPVWSLLLLDNIVFVQSYTKRIAGYESNCYMISKNERSLYYAFDKHFNNMWELSEEYHYSNG